MRITFEMLSRHIKTTDEQDTSVIPLLIRKVLYRKILGEYKDGEEIYFISNKPYAGVMTPKVKLSEIPESLLDLGTSAIALPEDYIKIAYGLTTVTQDFYASYKLRKVTEVSAIPSKTVLSEDWQKMESK